MFVCSKKNQAKCGRKRKPKNGFGEVALRNIFVCFTKYSLGKIEDVLHKAQNRFK